MRCETDTFSDENKFSSFFGGKNVERAVLLMGDGASIKVASLETGVCR